MLGSIPFYVLAPEARATDRWMRFAERDHLAEEPEDVFVLFQPTPVQPRRFVVLVVWIVVTVLGLQEFVAHAKHRRTVRQQQETDEVLHLLLANLHYSVGDIFDSFPAMVVRVFLSTIPVVFAVGPVVLFAVGDEVVQRKPIVRRDVVDAQ